jgi:hypothetical protein
LAERYAAALFDLADERHELDAIAADLRELRTMLQQSGDLTGLLRSPVLSREDQGKAIAALAEAAGASRPPAAAFVASRSGRGTNGVALSPPDAMPLTFGEPSFDNHVRVARERGLGPRVLSLPGLALDIDDPDDLATLRAEGAATESGRLLATWDLASRLGLAAQAPSD